MRPRVVVDASGDADVCHLAGAPYERPAREGSVQSLSTVFRMANVDTDRAEAVPKEELWRADARGVGVRRVRATAARGLGAPDAAAGRDDGADDADARRGRDRSRAADARGDRGPPPVPRVLPLPPRARTGLRGGGARLDEPRDRRPREPPHPRRARPHGATRSSPRTRFPDEIAQCGAPIEDHHAGSDTRWAYLPEGATYGIPYRSLLPREVDERRRRRALLLGDARRARLRAQHGHVHGDGPGGGNGGGARGGGRRTVRHASSIRQALRARLREDGAACRRLSGIREERFVAVIRRGRRISMRPPRSWSRPGIGVLEFTLDSPGALEAIARWRGRATVLAGTVRTAGRGRRRHVEAGAAALVSPCSIRSLCARNTQCRSCQAASPQARSSRPGGSARRSSSSSPQARSARATSARSSHRSPTCRSSSPAGSRPRTRCDFLAAGAVAVGADSSRAVAVWQRVRVAR